MNYVTYFQNYVTLSGVNRLYLCIWEINSQFKI